MGEGEVAVSVDLDDGEVAIDRSRCGLQAVSHHKPGGKAGWNVKVKPTILVDRERNAGLPDDDSVRRQLLRELIRPSEVLPENQLAVDFFEGQRICCHVGSLSYTE